MILDVAIVTAIANAWSKQAELNMLIWNSLTPEQKTKIITWTIEDAQNWRDFWKKVADSFKEINK
jgi:hypothetical protein